MTQGCSVSAQRPRNLRQTRNSASNCPLAYPRSNLHQVRVSVARVKLFNRCVEAPASFVDEFGQGTVIAGGSLSLLQSGSRDSRLVLKRLGLVEWIGRLTR